MRWIAPTGAIAALLAACGGKATNTLFGPDDDGDDLSVTIGDGDGDGDDASGAGSAGSHPAGAGGAGTTPPPSASGGATSSPTSCQFTIDDDLPYNGGPITSADGAWWGYPFAASSEGSTIMPTEFTGPALAVSGVLGAGYEEWAMIGWNIAQDIDPDTLEGGEVRAISPGGAGVNVRVANHVFSALRIQIQTDSSASESWCAPLPPAGGLVPWSYFTKECWVPGGEVYDGVTPIATIAVQTFSTSDTVPTSFDFCILELGPI